MRSQPQCSEGLEGFPLAFTELRDPAGVSSRVAEVPCAPFAEEQYHGWHFHIQQKIPNCVSKGERKARSLFIPVKGNLGVDEDAAEIPHLAEFGLWVMALQCLRAGSGMGTGCPDPFGMNREPRCVNPQ